MGINNLKYVNGIGIKSVLCKSNMGNNIYILNNGQKYKEFCNDYKNLRKKVNQELKDILIKQTKYFNHKIISFPEFVITDEKFLHGIITNYEEGKTYYEIAPTIEFAYLIYLIERLENGIKDISEDSWLLEDLHEENILINLKDESKSIKIIDTDFYTISSLQEDTYKYNLKRIFSSTIYSIFPEIRAIYLSNPDIKKAYILASEGYIKSSDFLRILQKELCLPKESTKNILTLRKTIPQL